MPAPEGAPKGRARTSRLGRGRGYGLLCAGLTLLLGALLILGLVPIRDGDGTYTSRPYGLSTGLENRALDLLFQLRRSGPRASDPVVIVGIDDEAVRAMGVRAQNWPRSLYARLVDAAHEGGATAIGLDLLLAGESGSTEAARAEDRSLEQALARAGNVVLAQKLPGGGSPAVRPMAAFAESAWATGFIDLPLESDGFLRTAALRVETADGVEESFAAKLVEGHRMALLYDRFHREALAHGLDEARAQGAAMAKAQAAALLRPGANGGISCGDRVVPLRRDGLLQLDFRGRSPAFSYVSAAALLRPGTAIPGLFRDRIVIIARTSTLDGDAFPTPFFETMGVARLLRPSLPSAPIRTSGAEIHATTVATLLEGWSPQRPSLGGQSLFLLLLLLGAAWPMFRLRTGWALAGLPVMAMVALGISLTAFTAHGLILPLASAWLGLALLAPLGLGLRHGRERALRSITEAERAQLMEIFSRCVSPEVAQTLWAQREHLGLAGERRVVTVVFTDIRDFTTLSEHSPSEDIVAWLSDYFARMNQVVTAAGGHINKFIGDGLMIVFGAPLGRSEREEAQAAVGCGLAMLEEVARLNAEWRGSSRPTLRIGVGIHTGEATCGVVGSPQRLEYTVIGDTVNLAARLESKTKELGVSLLLSEATSQRLEGKVALRPVGALEMKGKAIKVEAFTPEGMEGGPHD